MAFIAINAANSAYRKVRKQTRQAATDGQKHPQWFGSLVNLLPETEEKQMDISLTDREQKEQDHRDSDDLYERLAWVVFDRVTGTMSFEIFIMANIVLVGITTGIELEAGSNPSETILRLVDFVTIVTLASFTIEVVLKVVAEGRRPWCYFTHQENGNFNTFDFFIVVASYCFLTSNSSGAVGALLER